MSKVQEADQFVCVCVHVGVGVGGGELGLPPFRPLIQG